MLTDASRCISFLMHDIARRARVRFDARVRGLGVTRAQWRVLMTLDRHDGCTQSDVAEFLDVERITLCRMIDRLAEAGMVERRADPADRRIWRLHLTAKAKPLVDELSAIAHDMEEELLQSLSAEQRRSLADLLVAVRDHIADEDDPVDTPIDAPAKVRAAG